MRKARIEFRLGVLEQLGRKRPGICEWDDLVVFSVHYKCGHINLLEVFGESVSENALMQS
jgi:hypothetical protein